MSLCWLSLPGDFALDREALCHCHIMRSSFHLKTDLSWPHKYSAYHLWQGSPLTLLCYWPLFRSRLCSSTVWRQLDNVHVSYNIASASPLTIQWLSMKSILVMINMGLSLSASLHAQASPCSPYNCSSLLANYCQTNIPHSCARPPHFSLKALLLMTADADTC